MNTYSLPSPPLSQLRTLELTADHEPLLQSFFERNPKYFIANHGEPAQPTDAHEEIHGERKRFVTLNKSQMATVQQMCMQKSDSWHIGSGSAKIAAKCIAHLKNVH